METEQGKTLKALQVAIQMETDGKKFYLKASQESGNEAGRKLLESLAAEEDIHKKNFEDIYASIKNNQGWPDLAPAPVDNLRTVFTESLEASEPGLKAKPTELAAVKTAMDMENKTYDYYKVQKESASGSVEKAFYEALMAQERGHYMVLSDYYEYLEDPAGWFVRTEHPTLDGG